MADESTPDVERDDALIAALLAAPSDGQEEAVTYDSDVGLARFSRWLTQASVHGTHEAAASIEPGVATVQPRPREEPLAAAGIAAMRRATFRAAPGEAASRQNAGRSDGSLRSLSRTGVDVRPSPSAAHQPDRSGLADVQARAGQEPNEPPGSAPRRPTVHDRVWLDEIELYAELIIAAQRSDEPLSREAIDAILGIHRRPDSETEAPIGNPNTPSDHEHAKPPAEPHRTSR